MDLILAKKRVLLLVSGGIVIYKSLDLISALKKEGAEIFVVMSEVFIASSVSREVREIIFRLKRWILNETYSIDNKCASAHQISPDSWCKKSESKGAVVPPADFLLESEKRGTPPKSEKRQLLARRGSGAGGAALLRKEKGESKKQNSDSIANNATF